MVKSSLSFGFGGKRRVCATRLHKCLIHPLILATKRSSILNLFPKARYEIRNQAFHQHLRTSRHGEMTNFATTEMQMQSPIWR